MEICECAHIAGKGRRVYCGDRAKARRYFFSGGGPEECGILDVRQKTDEDRRRPKNENPELTVSKKCGNICICVTERRQKGAVT